MEEAIAFYSEAESAEDGEVRRSVRATLGRNDLFYLGVYICGRKDLIHPWLYERIREVESNPNGYLDLWARDHYKSTIITFLLTIQDVLNDPNTTIAIFSHTQEIAAAFLRQIKQEFETNSDLKYLYPDVLYEHPAVQSPKWSEKEGLVVKRSNNPKEATIEAWGVVKGQPTSRHFKKRIYDDLVTIESVSGPEAIAKTTACFRMSDNLGSEGGIVRMVGTRYNLFDTYHDIIKAGTIKPRIHAATSDGTDDCTKAVFMTPARLTEKRRDQGAFIFHCQMLQNPRADASVGFQDAHLRYWEPIHYKNLSICIIVDPASGKLRKKNDYTAMWVLGRGGDGNWYIIDLIRDRLSLPKRVRMVMHLHRTYRPAPACVFYEQTGMSADIEAIKMVQEQENYRFDITPVTPRGIPKPQRIERLIPLYEQGRIYQPRSIIHHDWEGKAVNTIQEFVTEEYLAYPVLAHDDGLDALSYIEDEDVKKLVPIPKSNSEKGEFALRQLQKLARRDRHKVVA